MGIGASAGGVEAFTRLLTALPADSGMAFVLLSHLSPTHHSELARLLSPATPMPVREATDGDVPHPNHVYVLPADRHMLIKDGRIRLQARNQQDGIPATIDRFFESLALEQGPSAVGVVLSGTGSDGTAGLQAIKAHGGKTFAQDPADAVHEGMPRSAIDAGAVDSTLPLERIAQALTSLATPSSPPAVSDARTPGACGDDTDPDRPLPHLSAGDAEAVESAIKVLQDATGVNFQHYKRPSLVRRIQRRAESVGVPQLADYVQRLRQEPDEVSALFQSVLIQVTRFFRESETFEALRTTVIPALAASRSGSAAVRVWVVGCATGEEAYSLAITFLEAEAALGTELPVRIFASDVSDSALAVARLGQYPESISAHVSAARLKQHFVALENGYQVSKRLRDMCVFARHDITRDPPFAQLDLVLCSNVLIYLDAVLQRRVLQNMHYALRPGGYLALGPAETAAGVEGLFSPFDRTRKIYLRRAGPARIQVTPGGGRAWQPAPLSDGQLPRGPQLPWSTAEVRRAAEQVFFAEYPSASVIVNREFEVLHYQGSTSPWLEAPTGGPTAQILRLAHPDLQLVIGRLLRRARKLNATTRRAGVPVRSGTRARRLTLTVLPVQLDDGEAQYFHVVFAAEPGHRSGSAGGEDAGPPGAPASRVRQLESELAESKEYLQSLIDQQDSVHAELQAAYEASLSVNEEYQSTNEELESAKEELQSLNEELNTLNEQLQQRNAELQARAAEVSALLEAVDMPLLLLSPDLRLRAFNARAAVDFHLAPASVGRTLGSGTLPVEQADLEGLIERASVQAEPQELELRDIEGRWRSLRVWPIQSGGGPDTVALAFVDIAKLKADVAVARDASAYKDAVVDTIMDPLVVLDDDDRIVHANHAFHVALGTSPSTMGRDRIQDLVGGAEPGTVDDFLALVRAATQPLAGPELEVSLAVDGKRVLRLSGGMIAWRGPPRVLLALEDVTDRKRAALAAQESSRMQAVGQLAGGIAHEINNQMTVVIGLVGFLLKATGTDDPRRPDIGQIGRAADRAAAISQQLLSFSRRQALRPAVFELNTIVASVEHLLHRLLGPGVSVEFELGERVGRVRADQAQLEQVLMNLVMNARDAMDGHGRLRIATQAVIVSDSPSDGPDEPAVPRGSYARLTVSDSGKGMDPQTQARIFEPFFTTKPIGQGSGLGLASVYGLVKQSGGLIWVESTPGQGATFTIDLPHVDLPIVPPMPAAVLEPAEEHRGTETVLLVDDEPLVRSLVSRVLTDLGYTVLEASDGRQALALLAQHVAEVGVVVSDVVMPVMDGAELRQRISEQFPAVPVVLMSGFGLEELAQKGVVDGSTALLSKPFSSAELSAKIRELVDRPA
ncbi:MAG TPA: chemotaxis protein CheB [Gemmatimonadales bacterium]|nr:chemotaxis protein CheB [Gemmatimonadales bacterium]